MELPRGIDPQLLHKPFPNIEHPKHDIGDGNYFEGAEDDTVPTPPQTPDDSNSSPATSYDQESSHSTESDDGTEQTRRSKRERPTSDLTSAVAKRPKLSDGIPDEVWDRHSLHPTSEFCLSKTNALPVYRGDPQRPGVVEKCSLSFSEVDALKLDSAAVLIVTKTEGTTIFSRNCGHPESHRMEDNKLFQKRKRCSCLFKRFDPVDVDGKAFLQGTLECNGSCWWGIKKCISFLFHDAEGAIVAHTEFRPTKDNTRRSGLQKKHA